MKPDPVPAHGDVEAQGECQRVMPAVPCLDVGAHVGLGAKPRETILRTRAEGFTSLQIFASSPSTWRVPNKSSEQLSQIRQYLVEAGTRALYIHAIYLVNLASADDQIYRRSMDSLIWTMRTGATIGARAVIVHVGSHRGLGFDLVRRQVVSALQHILEESPDAVTLLLENSAGAGGCIGANFDELGVLIQDLQGPANLGVCLDTAHIFAMGCDIRTRAGVDTVLEAIDNGPGLSRLGLVHANDSKVPLGSRRDRHENIGKGEIGIVGFENLLSRREVRGLSFILETPDLEHRSTDLALLRSTFDTATASRNAGSPGS